MPRYATSRRTFLKGLAAASATALVASPGTVLGEAAAPVRRGPQAPPLDKKLVGTLLQEALQAGASSATIYAERRHRQVFEVVDGVVVREEESLQLGSDIRVRQGEMTSFAVADGYEEDDLRRLLAMVKDDLTGSSASGRGVTIGSRRLPKKNIIVQEPAWKLPLQARRVYAQRAISGGRGDDRVTKVRSFLVEEELSWVLMDDTGLWCEDTLPMVTLTVDVVAEADGRASHGQAFHGARSGYELFSWRTPEQVAEAARDRALAHLTAEAPPATIDEVVVEAGAGPLLYGLIGAALEWEGRGGGKSFLHERQRDVIAAPNVTIVNNPTLRRTLGTYNIDARGNVPLRNAVIGGGRYVSGLTPFDTRSVNTGHTFKEGLGNSPRPRLSNLILEPGTDAPESLREKVRNGVSVDLIDDVAADPVAGTFSIAVSSGQRYREGKPVGQLQPFTLTGNSEAVLKGIRGIGNNLAYRGGFLDDGHAVSYGNPTLLLEGLEVLSNDDSDE